MARFLLALWAGLLVSCTVIDSTYPPPCDSAVYCAPGPGSLLHVVQMARLFPDSKTFVDMPMKHEEEKVLAAFEQMMAVRTGNESMSQSQKVSEFQSVRIQKVSE